MEEERNEAELDRAAARRKRRRQEQTKVVAIAAGAAGVVLLILILIISSIVNTLIKKNKTEAVQETASVETEEVLEVDNVIPEAQEGQEYESETFEEEEEVVEEETVDDTDAAEAEEEEVVPEEEEEQVEEGPAEEELDQMVEEQVANQISSMSIEDKVAQLFFITPGQLLGKESAVDGAGSAFNDKLNKYQIGGVLLEASNMRDANSLSDMISNIQLMVGYPMFVGISDEGGENSPLIQSRVSENVISSEKEIGASLGDSGAYSAGISIGGEMKMFGLNVDFAPYVDVSLQKGSVAEQHGFGTDVETTASLTRNFIKGLEDQGIQSAVKYFPSYGDATQDGKNGQVTSQRSKEQLAEGYLPYQEAIDAGADFVMISHVGLPKLRGDRRPASLSKEVITDIVRDEWGYDGIVITDYMNKSCIYNSYTYAEAAVGAIEAGADMILSVKNFEKSYNGLLDAVKKGTITEERIDESLVRIFRVKYRMEN